MVDEDNNVEDVELDMEDYRVNINLDDEHIGEN